MSGFNKAIIMGNLGQDPELKYTGTGTPVCRLSVATTRNWTDKENNKHEETEWHRVTVWGRTAENCNEYLSKGRQVLVEGRIRTQKWDDKDGITRYSTEIVADSVQFVGGSTGGGDATNKPQKETPGRLRTASGQFSGPAGTPPGPEDDDIPF